MHSRKVTLCCLQISHLYFFLCCPISVGQGPVTCDTWDCNCTFNRQRGCCCAANDMYQIEEDAFMRMTYLWHDISILGSRVQELAGKQVHDAGPDIWNSRQTADDTFPRIFLRGHRKFFFFKVELYSIGQTVCLLHSSGPNRFVTTCLAR